MARVPVAMRVRDNWIGNHRTKQMHATLWHEVGRIQIAGSCGPISLAVGIAVGKPATHMDLFAPSNFCEHDLFPLRFGERGFCLLESLAGIRVIAELERDFAAADDAWAFNQFG
jgi:hypothetical protein